MSQSRQDRKAIPVALNLFLAVFVASAPVFVHFLLPFLYPLKPELVWLVFPLALVNLPFWALLHEGIHGVYHPGKGINRFVSRVLSILFGSPFLLLQFGHLAHHRFNRSRIDRTEIYESGQNPILASLRYYWFITGGLYLMEFLAGMASLLPRTLLLSLVQKKLTDRSEEEKRLRELALNRLLSRGALLEMRVDALAIIALLAVSFRLYGSASWIVVLYLVLRGFLVSFLDNIYHYGSPVGVPDFSYNLRVPAPLSWFLLRFNYHHVHHSRPRLPWIHLRNAFLKDGERYHSPYWRAALRQFRGPIPEHSQIWPRFSRLSHLDSRDTSIGT